MSKPRIRIYFGVMGDKPSFKAELLSGNCLPYRVKELDRFMELVYKSYIDDGCKGAERMLSVARKKFIINPKNNDTTFYC